MSGDSLVYDMSMMSEGSPQLFVKKDFLALQDQQSGNYAGNQLVIDTSQLANSNKYTDYRNAYLTVPLVMAMTTKTTAAAQTETIMTEANGDLVDGITQVPSLKNWFGSIVSSMLLDYAGTTIIQNTPLTGLWSCFSLLTSLSMSDVETLGPTIGFYPDSSSFRLITAAAGSPAGQGTCNNVKSAAAGKLNALVGSQQIGNKGIEQRWSKLMIDHEAKSCGDLGETYSTVLSDTAMDQVYRSRVAKKGKVVSDGKYVAGVVFQIQAFIYLRHLHSFFSQIPLLKGVFFRLTLNLNQPIINLECGVQSLKITDITSPLGGVVPIMIASQKAEVSELGIGVDGTDYEAQTEANWGLNLSALHANDGNKMRVSLNVGNKIIDSVQKANASAIAFSSSSLNESCFLHVPMYTFNPSFESAYLSKPTKTIVYSDLYQYTTAEVGSAGQFNFLITNGISNIKSVLVIPMESTIAGNGSYPPFYSPFDTCGGGTTAPLAGSSLTNFNVVVAGQNMIYNQVTRAFEEFNNQLYGVNAVNSGLTDGLTSGLIDYWDFLQSYGYFYVNCARQLPIDEAVPKSVSIQGTNQSLKAMKLYVFIEYGVQVNVDVLTGSRV